MTQNFTVGLNREDVYRHIIALCQNDALFAIAEYGSNRQAKDLERIVISDQKLLKQIGRGRGAVIGTIRLLPSGDETAVIFADKDAYWHEPITDSGKLLFTQFILRASEHFGGLDLLKSSNINNATQPELETIIKGLARAMHPLQHRKKNLPSLAFDNEYDVQDLLHAMLRPWASDIRPEEYTPSYAGSSTRIDFVIADLKMVIEVKYVRDRSHAKKIGDELILDIAHYGTHPQCQSLWVVVYDPNKLIQNPDGLASDLEKQTEKINVRTFVLS